MVPLRRRATAVLGAEAGRLVALLLWAVGPIALIHSLGLALTVILSVARGALDGRIILRSRDILGLADVADLPELTVLWTIRCLQIICTGTGAFLLGRLLFG